MGTIAKSLGFNVISLDLKNADINCDILEWDYKNLTETILILFGAVLRAPNTVEQKQHEKETLNMQIVLS